MKSFIKVLIVLPPAIVLGGKVFSFLKYMDGVAKFGALVPVIFLLLVIYCISKGVERIYKKFAWKGAAFIMSGYLIATVGIFISMLLGPRFEFGYTPPGRDGIVPCFDNPDTADNECLKFILNES